MDWKWLSKIDAVIVDDAAEIIDRIFNKSSLAISVVGPLESVNGLFDSLK